MNHLIFFDGKCPFCSHWVKTLMEWDKAGLFIFAPLEGDTAIKYLGKEIKTPDAVVLIENTGKQKLKMFEGGKAVLRILWLLHGKWRLLGWLYFMPFGANVLYRFIAHRRDRLSESFPVWTEEEKKRILS